MSFKIQLLRNSEANLFNSHDEAILKLKETLEDNTGFMDQRSDGECVIARYRHGEDDAEIGTLFCIYSVMMVDGVTRRVPTIVNVEELELVTSAAIHRLKHSCGFDNNGMFASGSLQFAQYAPSLAIAIQMLDSKIAEQDATITAQQEIIDDLNTRLAALENA